VISYRWLFGKNKKIHISSSFNWQNCFGRHFENRLGNYRVIITSTATNQCREFSKITYVIVLIIGLAPTDTLYRWIGRTHGQIRGIFLFWSFKVFDEYASERKINRNKKLGRISEVLIKIFVSIFACMHAYLRHWHLFSIAYFKVNNKTKVHLCHFCKDKVIPDYKQT
jgi:hypothetical protein